MVGNVLEARLWRVSGPNPSCSDPAFLQPSLSSFQTNCLLSKGDTESPVPHPRAAPVCVTSSKVSRVETEVIPLGLNQRGVKTKILTILFYREQRIRRKAAWEASFFRMKFAFGLALSPRATFCNYAHSPCTPCRPPHLGEPPD